MDDNDLDCLLEMAERVLGSPVSLTRVRDAAAGQWRANELPDAVGSRFAYGQSAAAAVCHLVVFHVEDVLR